MADLNADVDEGLSDTLIEPPINTSEGSKDLSFVTPVNNNADLNEPISETDLFGPSIEPGVLPNIEAQFTLVNQQRTKIVDLKEVEAEISGKQTVSQEDAKIVDAVFGNFLTPNLRIQEFTQKPSKVNLGLTMKYINNRISTESIQLVEQSVAFFQAPAEEVKLFVEKFESVYSPRIANQLAAISESYVRVLTTVSEFNNAVLPMGSGFANIAKIPLQSIDPKELDFKALKLDAVAEKKIKASLEVTRELLRHHYLASFIIQSLANKLVEVPTNDEVAALMQNGSGLTISDLIKFYKNQNNIISQLETLGGMAIKARDYFTTMYTNAEALKNSNDVGEFDSFITESTVEIESTSLQYQFAAEVAHKLVLLNNAMYNVFGLLDSCV